MEKHKTMEKHKPNPFDFVPFPNDSEPDLRTISEWLSVSYERATGSLTVQIEALTPVHIVGKQDTNNPSNDDEIRITHSAFWRSGGKPTIPASSIRGTLRSFIEAATNGWVSEITPYYKQERDKRQVGFMTIDAEDELKEGDVVDGDLPKMLPKAFRPKDRADGKIDLGSFLFGFVAGESAAKGRVQIEDAPISAKLDDSGQWQIPDIPGKALMGGPNPSAKTWWYMVPSGIRKRTVFARGRNQTIVDFLGSQFRGRKFYYHQAPNACLEYYTTKWKPPKGKKVESFPIECLPPKAESQSFQISFRELPLPILYFLIWALQPGKNFCHKLGYGKPFGYGSIRFHIVNVDVEPALDLPGQEVPPLEILEDADGYAWKAADFAKSDIASLLHMSSVLALARILYYKEPLQQIFVWPTFDANGFLPIVYDSEVRSALVAKEISNGFPNLLDLDEDEARELAEEIASMRRKGQPIKPALHFDVYQEAAEGYDDIQKRTLADALGA